MVSTPRQERSKTTSQGFWRTLRQDAWWTEPLVTALVLLAFVVYATFRTFENNFFLTEIHLRDKWERGEVSHLLSPFYSPLFLVDWRIFGLHVSPALLILPFPLSFRLTCYYYRKAYYRSFFWSPPACAVKGPVERPRYEGERSFPFVLQNLHRFALYFALIFLIILSVDVIKSMRYVNGWGISIGTFVLLINVVLLSGYTLGCHSFRHLVGGSLNCFSCSAFHHARYQAFQGVSWLNNRHALWAWASLIWVALSDLYIRLVTSGILQDYVLAKF